MSQTYTGQCHCGATTVAFDTTTSPEQTQIRECQCSFCRKHGSTNASDPDGRLELDNMRLSSDALTLEGEVALAGGVLELADVNGQITPPELYAPLIASIIANLPETKTSA